MMYILLFLAVVAFLGFSKNLDVYNIDADRLICTNNAICDEIKLAMDGKTIRDFCINSVDKVAIDVDYNVYFHVFTPFVAGKSKKVGCTGTDLLVMMFDGIVYRKEENGNFGQIATEVMDIVTHENSFFLIKSDNSILMGGKDFEGNTIVGLSSITFPPAGVVGAPRILPIDKGALFSFESVISGSKHFFMGADHPTDSTLVNNYASSPIQLDFDSAAGSQIENADPIDFIGRPNDGCMVIVSGTDFYVSGSNCPNDYPLQTPFLVPYKINAVTYGAMDENAMIRDFVCEGQACYILTEEKIFGFGKNSPIFTGQSTSFIEVDSPFTTNAISLIPSIGYPNDFYSFSKQEITDGTDVRVLDEDAVNKFPPSFNKANSGILDSSLSIQLEKEETMGQMESVITMGKTAAAKKVCSLNNDADLSIWSLKNINGKDYYTSTTPWTDHTANCGWEDDDTDPDYFIWRNRINFEEHFMLNYKQSFMQERIEEYELDLIMRFKKQITLSTEINTEREAFGSQFVVIEKEWDRETSTGIIYIQVKHDIGVLTDVLNLQTVTAAPQAFANVNLEEDINQLDCTDGLNCYQVFKLTYVLNSGVCDPSSAFGFIGTLKCVAGGHDNCIGLGNENEQFSINVLSEDVCATLQEDIDLDGSVSVYSDWTYLEQANSFNLGEYGYFLIDVSSLGNKATIESSEIEKIQLETYDITTGAMKTMKTMYQKGVTTGLLVLDSNSNWEVTRTGFHMEMKQDDLQLAYGEQVTAKVLITIKVGYLGNARRRTIQLATGIRRSVPMSTTDATYGSELISPQFSITGISATNVNAMIGWIIGVATFGTIFAAAIAVLGLGGLSAVLYGLKRNNAKKMKKEKAELEKNELKMTSTTENQEPSVPAKI